MKEIKFYREIEIKQRKEEKKEEMSDELNIQIGSRNLKLEDLMVKRPGDYTENIREDFEKFSDNNETESNFGSQ
jgi:hypothetical protein